VGCISIPAASEVIEVWQNDGNAVHASDQRRNEQALNNACRKAQHIHMLLV
jgi:hypothetical protein